jgi:hypothetical protein
MYEGTRTAIVEWTVADPVRSTPMSPLAAVPDHATTWSWLALGLAGAVVLAFVVLFVSALFSILGSRLTGGMKLVWVVFAFCAPFLGSLLWFAFGRRDAGEPVRR